MPPAECVPRRHPAGLRPRAGPVSSEWSARPAARWRRGFYLALGISGSMHHVGGHQGLHAASSRSTSTPRRRSFPIRTKDSWPTSRRCCRCLLERVKAGTGGARMKSIMMPSSSAPVRPVPAAALTMARAGLDVALLERGHLSRRKEHVRRGAAPAARAGRDLPRLLGAGPAGAAHRQEGRYLHDRRGATSTSASTPATSIAPLTTATPSSAPASTTGSPKRRSRPVPP